MTVVGSREELAERALRGLDAVEELHRPWIDEVVIGCPSAAPRPSGCPTSATAGWTPGSSRSRRWAGRTTPSSSTATPPGAGEGLTIADLPTHEDWEQLVPGRLGDRDARADPPVVLLDALHERRARRAAAVQARVVYEKVNDENGRPMHKSWGNAIWFDDAVESMGADVMRWMYANQTPGQNLSFGYGPADQVKRRLLTLWNSYAFFVTTRGSTTTGRRTDARVRPRGRRAAAARPLAAGADAGDGRGVPRRARRVRLAAAGARRRGVQSTISRRGTSASPAGASGRTRTMPASRRPTTRCGTRWCS